MAACPWPDLLEKPWAVVQRWAFVIDAIALFGFCRLRSLFGVAQQPAGVAVTFSCRVCAGGPQTQSDLHAGACLQSQRCSQYGNGTCCRYRQCGRPHDAPSCRDGCSQGFSKLENPGFPKASVTSQG